MGGGPQFETLEKLEKPRVATLACASAVENVAYFTNSAASKVDAVSIRASTLVNAQFF